MGAKETESCEWTQTHLDQDVWTSALLMFGLKNSSVCGAVPCIVEYFTASLASAH